MPYPRCKATDDDGAGVRPDAARAATRTLSTRLTTTVPREYVHRTAVSEVLLTDWETEEPTGGGDRDAFTVRAQWPRSHALFAREGAYQDPMLLIESVRQTGSLLAHVGFDVPFGYQFLMWDMFFDAAPELLVAGAVPTDVELRTVCRDIVRRHHSLSAMRYDVTVLRDGKALATAGAAFRCMSPDVFRRLRGRRPAPTPAPGTPGTARPALDPAAVGHSSARHVVLAEPAPGAGNRWELRVDTAHPTYFDHPVDHVPGMVLIEAARQAAHASTALPDALLLGARSRFLRYTELDAPCWIEACTGPRDATGDIPVRVAGIQRGETVFTADLTLSPRTH